MIVASSLDILCILIKHRHNNYQPIATFDFLHTAFVLYLLTVHEAKYMATFTIIATSTPGLSGTFYWSTLGYMLLAVGILATYLSGRRYLLGYLLGGMGYWVLIEGIQSIVVNVTSMSSGYGYLTAVLLTVAAASSYLGYRYRQFVATMDTQKTGVESLSHRRAAPLSAAVKTRTPKDKYIEHTPIYNNYRPRFRN